MNEMWRTRNVDATLYTGVHKKMSEWAAKSKTINRLFNILLTEN